MNPVQEIKDEIWREILATIDGIPEGNLGGYRSIAYWAETDRWITGLCIYSVAQGDGSSVIYRIEGHKNVPPHKTGLSDKVEIRVETWLDNHNRFWQDILDRREKNLDRRVSVVIDNEHYMIGPETEDPKEFRGFGGREFVIELLTLDGQVLQTVHTTNLWAQGTIPPAWRDRFPNNARFVTPQRQSGDQTELRYRTWGGTDRSGLPVHVGDTVEVRPETSDFDRPAWTLRERGRVVALVESRAAVELVGLEAPMTFRPADLFLIRRVAGRGSA